MAIHSRNNHKDSSESNTDDVEVGDAESPKSHGSKGKDDPFGDETNSEVKYRTMAWWLVYPINMFLKIQVY